MNLNTYKVHALGDYVETIRRYGTTDSYSTESVRQSDVYNIAKLIVNCLGRTGTSHTQDHLFPDQP